MKTIEEYQQKVKNEITFKQELRKSKELDIFKIQERNKKIQALKKSMILEKQMEASKALDEIKVENEELVKKLIEDDITWN